MCVGVSVCVCGGAEVEAVAASKKANFWCFGRALLIRDGPISVICGIAVMQVKGRWKNVVWKLQSQFCMQGDN